MFLYEVQPVNHNTPLCSSQTRKEYDTFQQQGFTFQHFTGVRFPQSRKPLCLRTERFFGHWIVWIFCFIVNSTTENSLNTETREFSSQRILPHVTGPRMGITLDVTIPKGRYMIGEDVLISLSFDKLFQRLFGHFVWTKCKVFEKAFRTFWGGKYCLST